MVLTLTPRTVPMHACPACGGLQSTSLTLQVHECPVAAGMVEAWLAKVVDGMQSTMKAVIKRANRNVNEQKLDEFLFGCPAQVALLGIQFQWTADTQVSCH